MLIQHAPTQLAQIVMERSLGFTFLIQCSFMRQNRLHAFDSLLNGKRLIRRGKAVLCRLGPTAGSKRQLTSGFSSERCCSPFVSISKLMRSCERKQARCDQVVILQVKEFIATKLLTRHMALLENARGRL